MTVSLGEALGWKYPGIPRITTRNGQLTGWPEDLLGPAPTIGQQAVIKAEYTAYLASIQYRENRRKEYPPLVDQLDMLHKDLRDGTTTFKDTIQAIKDKYPKPQ